MEVPCVYRFTGKQSHIKLLANLLDLENNLSVRDVHKEEGSLKRSTEQVESCNKENKPC